jgi:hypothetical protein
MVARSNRTRRQSDRPSSSLWQVIVGFVAPTTTVTAILFYFGWVRASTTFGYFGVDVERTVGLSSSDYILRSSTVVFTPLAGLVLLALVILLGFRITDGYLVRPAHRRLLKQVSTGVAIAAAVFLLIAGVLLLRVSWLGGAPVVKPILLAVGALLAGYATHLRRLPGGPGRSRQSGGSALFRDLYRGTCVALLVLALFWATSILAYNQGLGVAHTIERTLINRTGVVVYSHDNLFISGRGINVVSLNPSSSTYRLRYTGLRLLARTADGGYLLLPRGWTHTDGNPVYVVSAADGIRVDLQTFPVD